MRKEPTAGYELSNLKTGAFLLRLMSAVVLLAGAAVGIALGVTSHQALGHHVDTGSIGYWAVGGFILGILGAGMVVAPLWIFVESSMCLATIERHLAFLRIELDRERQLRTGRGEEGSTRAEQR